MSAKHAKPNQQLSSITIADTADRPNERRHESSAFQRKINSCIESSLDRSVVVGEMVAIRLLIALSVLFAFCQADNKVNAVDNEAVSSAPTLT